MAKIALILASLALALALLGTGFLIGHSTHDDPAPTTTTETDSGGDGGGSRSSAKDYWDCFEANGPGYPC